jgi:protein gp37
MFRDKERWKQDPTVVMRSKANFNDPLNWQRQIGAWPLIDSTSFLGMKIFTCSWSDFFIEEADEWRAEAWAIIKATPEFTYQILTKRPERIAEHLPEDWGSGYPNVWLGVTAEDQVSAELRIPILMDLPAAIRFVSFEPLIGKIDLYPVFKGWTGKNYDRMYPFDWAIIGGESGNDEGKYLYRECSIYWMFDLIFSLDIWLIPIWVKQMGTHISKHLGMKNRHGQDMSEWPDKLQRQEFPEQIQAAPPSNAVPIPLPGHYPVLPTTGLVYTNQPLANLNDEDLNPFASIEGEDDLYL